MAWARPLLRVPPLPAPTAPPLPAPRVLPPPRLPPPRRAHHQAGSMLPLRLMPPPRAHHQAGSMLPLLLMALPAALPPPGVLLPPVGRRPRSLAPRSHLLRCCSPCRLGLQRLAPDLAATPASHARHPTGSPVLCRAGPLMLGCEFPELCQPPLEGIKSSQCFLRRLPPTSRARHQRQPCRLQSDVRRVCCWKPHVQTTTFTCTDRTQAEECGTEGVKVVQGDVPPH